ncbi:hypothetical protein GCM10010922_12310 [Microbacterium sorbitolivorans]|nr:hypothetical protein GCM10010922_12310 [Microbacterium sorbitolivorans]
MIRDENIDRAIIASRDDTHATLIIRCLEAGIDVMVEKPLTIDAESAAAIEDAVARTGRNVVVTFNYRYSPRNSALREVIQSGRIGTVTSIDFSWMLDTKHGADYFRRWHRDKTNAGGLLVHKSSHHFDLVNWWIDSAPRRVYASGALRFYGSDNAASRGLPARPPRGTHEGTHDPFELDLRDDPRLQALYLDAEAEDGYIRDTDVFTDGITIEDNLALIVDYASGATLSYSLNAHSPLGGVPRRRQRHRGPRRARRRRTRIAGRERGPAPRARPLLQCRRGRLVAARGRPVDPAAPLGRTRRDRHRLGPRRARRR